MTRHENVQGTSELKFKHRKPGTILHWKTSGNENIPPFKNEALPWRTTRERYPLCAKSVKNSGGLGLLVVHVLK